MNKDEYKKIIGNEKKYIKYLKVIRSIQTLIWDAYTEPVDEIRRLKINAVSDMLLSLANEFKKEAEKAKKNDSE